MYTYILCLGMLSYKDYQDWGQECIHVLGMKPNLTYAYKNGI